MPRTKDAEDPDRLLVELRAVQGYAQGLFDQRFERYLTRAIHCIEALRAERNALTERLAIRDRPIGFGQ